MPSSHGPAIALLILTSVAVIACEHPSPPSVSTEHLASGELARVGAVTLPSSLVAEVARAQSVPPRVALDELAEDALLAQRAAATHMMDVPAVRWACISALARRVPVRLADAARAAGPPTDDEIAMRTVVHAVVMRGRNLPERTGLGVAAAIQQAVQGAPTVEDFEKRASAVPHSGARIRVERISAFGPDGQTVDGGGLDPTFVAAAFTLPSPSVVSPIVVTRFGWHVIRLIEQVMPDRSVIEERRQALASTVISMRARSALAALERERRRKTEVSVAPQAEALMALAAEGLK